ncbi:MULTISPECIES: NAD-dependent succinate-semialdehyde dehydrogenase [Halorubrum]|jgi:succinate-semialdehyde dehydrogenase/glutarate-semialdehyde dehydrogenase|uniref:NADP-dependent succinic semialdehyde dehydrogenase n=2 Tax=Halorubrum ezzemoulense TaxID=337243 RepID=A0A256K439_HALEZ|nr:MULTISPECIES: NAD-dependent succinate-semialdehyde dehydrogenase [Halorubrum]MDB2226299.1 NAD-dependent succinate-semialdehyde dehydrogenase [Halorubrum ezzemoulense]MDB2262208.1 NAD-dependent succinate-semialdehyde dehydrogenase [Halorubrum ezzemoulense]MDB2265131.1 NAD-dependent succinate-semialdehyde dehydrogenase [Halorubrum ezzemoulense]MDB2269043.1 NAD-dependent succinate-semialdehyde dehydrogenase [Halorubrum ezzemoulense]MDB2272487.1 NAD-dependent succinate-semialdehyde dehydrogenas
MDVVNPATGARVETYDDHDEDDVEAALDRSEQAFKDWQTRPLREREQLLANAAEVLRENKQEYAETMTREMGKPISQAVGEVEKCAWVCEHYAEHASAYLEADHHPSPPGSEVKTEHEPLGTVLAVMPWNFPLWQVFRFAAPYLTAGNVGILKHASNVPGCALAIEEVFQKAGYPDDVFQSLLIPSDLVDNLLTDSRVRAATLTGSGPAGRAVAANAGDQLKKTVLELGGSDPFVVLDDADLSAAAETGAWARNLNGGQSCIAAKRFIVHTDVYDEFLGSLTDEMDSLVVGDPTNEETDIGPQAREDLMETLHEQVTASVEAGATLVTGGEPLDREGAFYPPTILTDPPEGCPVDTEETFGPVATVYEVDDEESAITKANDTPFGLGASVWTQDRDRGERVASRIDAGCVYVNQLVKSDPRVPFGGVKDSGYGRELSEAGIKEFVNRKTVWIE